MGTASRPARTSAASWDAFSDVDAFVDAVRAELAAKAADGTPQTSTGPKQPLTEAALRKAINHSDPVPLFLRYAVAGKRTTKPVVYTFEATQRQGRFSTNGRIRCR